jgi:hypothetical protein
MGPVFKGPDHGYDGLFPFAAGNGIHLVAGLQDLCRTEGGVGSADHCGDRRVYRLDLAENAQGVVDSHGHGGGAGQMRFERLQE